MWVGWCALTRVAFGPNLCYFRIVRCILGAVLAFGCLLGFLPGGWLIVGRLSGMSTVKVHEWCLVCYGWLAVCSRSNVHACIPLQLRGKA
jgi:hypothetical protein